MICRGKIQSTLMTGELCFVSLEFKINLIYYEILLDITTTILSDSSWFKNKFFIIFVTVIKTNDSAFDMPDKIKLLIL